MASAVYPVSLGAALAALFPNTPTIQALSSTYVYSAAHDFANDLSGVLGDPIALTSPAYTSGIFTADDPTITGLSNGNVIVAFAIYNDTGTAATSRLVAFIDTDSTGAAISYTSDGSDLPVAFPGVTILSI